MGLPGKSRNLHFKQAPQMILMNLNPGKPTDLILLLFKNLSSLHPTLAPASSLFLHFFFFFLSQVLPQCCLHFLTLSTCSGTCPQHPLPNLSDTFQLFSCLMSQIPVDKGDYSSHPETFFYMGSVIPCSPGFPPTPYAALQSLFQAPFLCLTSK